MKTKKRIYIGILFLFLGMLFFVPVVPQAVPFEVLTPKGGYMEVAYTYFSINEIIQYPERHFSWFPHNNQTKKYNLIALVTAIVVIALIGWFFLRRIKKQFKQVKN